MTGAFGHVGGVGGVGGAGHAEATGGPGGSCPCRPSETYASCCRPLHEGEAAPTAEALMRSRYSAFAVGDEGYLLRTWHPRTRPESLSLDPRHRWVELRVLGHRDGAADDETGEVTYRATSRNAAGHTHHLTETARFARRAGRWVYVDGDITD